MTTSSTTPPKSILAIACSLLNDYEFLNPMYTAKLNRFHKISVAPKPASARYDRCFCNEIG
jgi:hypothetical protein